jgi:hypothetical protein
MALVSASSGVLISSSGSGTVRSENVPQEDFFDKPPELILAKFSEFFFEL